MQFNPFESTSSSNSTFTFASTDFKAASSRLKYLSEHCGFGLFTGGPGTGKTFTLRSFLSELNRNLYKVYYTPLSTVTTMDFYRNLALGLDLVPAFHKAMLFRQIQERITYLHKDMRITPVIVLDEGQYLNTAVINDLKILFNFDMDSTSRAVVIISGLPSLSTILLKQIHEAVVQRIIVRYCFQGLSRSDTELYIMQGLHACGASDKIISPAAVEAFSNASAGSLRKLNSLLTSALILGASSHLDSINPDTVMAAFNDLNAA